MRIFLFDGLAIGGIGTLLVVLALVAGTSKRSGKWLQRTLDIVLFDETLYLLAELPARISWGEVVMIAVMAVVFAFAGLPHLARAARLDPVEGLRRGEGAIQAERWLALSGDPAEGGVRLPSRRPRSAWPLGSPP
ncbi:MAG: hypothetical protein U1E23_08785 [Reyranellaceae bacterium]